ncbi:histidine kinase [Desulfobacter hydrogenophilus]|uniref:histidine kinase n=1 Tax=Desulfobacter hydrogenophilus TaxID=2291 RepID=A0A328FGL4_9BACT|nr:ATP-binding protein [Desulfobacter hydrogenophilus]NDY70661.1 HAMP domain-containing protein [Desulfobacter hydrogenophilus]QBH14024.1 HAMP domain-containing protein [Desulfobacter hydrogenophilus]RAM03559.1 histidine kinase [Desulfobacter hydrogenophilus]
MGLRTRIIIFVVVAFCAVNLFLCFYITHQVKVLELKKLRVQINKSTYLMRIINTLPLYNVDRESLKMNMETFFDDENMKRLTIHDSEVNININLERQLPLGGTDIKKSFVIDYKGLKLGRLTVVYSTGLIEKKLAKFQTRMLEVTLFVILVIAVVLAFSINIITKPLGRLARITSEIAAGNFDNEIEQTDVGEVGTLSRNFVRMRDTVKEKKEEISRINTMLEGDIQQKNMQGRKILYQRMLISSVNTFFQQSMTAQSIQEIAEIFIPIAQGVVPGPYCFVGQVCDTENNLKILALSDQVEKQCPMFDEAVINHGFRQPISGRLVEAIANKAPVISNNVSLNSEFYFLSKEHLPVETIMALPMLYGKDVFGLAVFAGKEGGYTPEDQEVATMMIMVLVEALTLRGRQEEKQQLEKTMVQSEKMVSVGKLAAGMVNEMNGPLDEIRRAAQMIRNSVEKPGPESLAAADKNSLSFDRLGRYLQDQSVFNNLNLIMEACKKASGIVSNMLSFSGNTKVDFVVEDLSLLLDESLELASSEYSLEQDFHFDAIQIMKDYDPDLPKVKCRGSELKQVFFNILSNGAYAMAGHTDSPCPTFFMRTYGKEGQVCVEIIDNGPGMPENIRRRVFEPFFSTRSDKEDAGLGLSVSYFIITENYNGTIEVESAPGEGTCFRIFLPI